MSKGKKILSVILAVVLCASFSMQAFAGSASRGGSATGTNGTMNTSASLSVNENSGTATTWAGVTAGVTLNTSIIYYYRVISTGHIATTNGSGSSSASAGNTTRTGYRATSQHSVNGGRAWGSWSTSLEASA